MSLLCKKKIFIRKFHLIWLDLDPISVKKQVGWRHRVKWPSLSISTRKITYDTCVRRHACNLFLVTFYGLTLALTSYKYDFHALTVPFSDICQHSGLVWPLCIPSTRSESSKCEHLVFCHFTWPLPDVCPWC